MNGSRFEALIIWRMRGKANFRKNLVFFSLEDRRVEEVEGCLVDNF
jgi:hypothetical protein